jgi:hypothetical protein
MAPEPPRLAGPRCVRGTTRRSRAIGRGLRDASARPRRGTGRLRRPALELAHRPGVSQGRDRRGGRRGGTAARSPGPATRWSSARPSTRHSSTGFPKRAPGSSKSRSSSAAGGSVWTWTGCRARSPPIPRPPAVQPAEPGRDGASPQELEALVRLARIYRVVLTSDEIHAPLVLPGAFFTPLPTVPERTSWRQRGVGQQGMESGRAQMRRRGHRLAGHGLAADQVPARLTVKSTGPRPVPLPGRAGGLPSRSIPRACLRLASFASSAAEIAFRTAQSAHPYSEATNLATSSSESSWSDRKSSRPMSALAASAESSVSPREPAVGCGGRLRLK